MVRLVIFVSAVAACSSSPATPVVGGTTTPTAAPAGGPVYAALFDGKPFTLAVSSTTTPPVDLGPQTKATLPDVTCTPTVETKGDLKIAKIACTGDAMFGMAPQGQFIATPAGLWWEFADRPLPATFDPKEMLIAATPAEHAQEIPDPEMEGSSEHYHAKRGAGDAWCFGYSMAAGDEGGWEMCTSAATGVVSGSAFNAGATTFEHVYKRK